MAKKRNESKGKQRRGLPRVAIVVSRYNASITDRLLSGATEVYENAGGRREDLTMVEAPGSFELPCLAMRAAAFGEVAGVLAIGCIIKGETSHDQYLAQAVANGLIEASLSTGVPVSFGVLTVDSVAQAEERAGGRHGNKGEESMRALLRAIRACAEIINDTEALDLLGELDGVNPDKAGARAGGGR